MPVLFQVPAANAASDHLPDEDWEDMLPPVRVENTAAQGQPQDLRYGGLGHYDDMANNHSPLHKHHDYAINSYTGLALDVPA